MNDEEKAALLDKIVEAWTSPGKYPKSWHYKAVQDVKFSMPVLSQHIERAVRESGK